MRYSRILICDSDRRYVEALISYLMESEKNNQLSTEVVGISDEKEFIQLNGNFEIGILSEKFFSIVKEKAGSPIIENLMILTEEKNKSSDENTFFKYQSMENLEKVLFGERTGQEIDSFGDNKRIIGVYSPNKHELSLLFSICLAKQLEHSVLFIDISEIGILPEVTGLFYEEDLIDAIYMLENRREEFRLEKYIQVYEELHILSPVMTPAQFAYINEEQWSLLLKEIMNSKYKNIVFLFGNLMPGFLEFIKHMDKLVILSKKGEIYSLYEKVFIDFINKLECGDKCLEVEIPFSGTNLTKGGYRIDALINGKLADYIRKKVRNRLGITEYSE